MKTSTRTFAVAPWTLLFILASGTFASAGDAADVPTTTNLAPTRAIPQPIRSNPPATPSTAVRPGTGALTPIPRSTREVDLSFWASEIVKLSRAGVDEDVILSFLDNVGTVNLGADQIIYLKQQGVSRDIISAMLQHDYEIGAGLRPIPTVPVGFAQRPFPSSGVSSTASAPPAAPPPSTAIEPSPPVAAPIDSTVGDPDLDLPLSEDMLAYHPGIPEHGYRIREPYPEKVTEPILILPASGRVANILLVDSTR